MNQLNRGRRLVEVLKQPQYQPLPVEKQVIIIYAATNGYLDPVPVERVRAYETELYKFLDTRKAALLTALRGEEGDRRHDQAGPEPGAGGVRQVVRRGGEGRRSVVITSDRNPPMPCGAAPAGVGEHQLATGD